jgi:colicin import membrane protein
MKAGFHQAHTEMARQSKAERQDFVEALGHGVANLRAGFRRAHRDMARKTRAERRAATNRLKKTVGARRREFALDLAGAHRIWFGPSPAELKAKAERRAKAEAERRAREEAERQRRATEARAKKEARPPAAGEARENARRPGKKKG